MRQTLLFEKFQNNQNEWEIVDAIDETAYIDEEGYHVSNKNENRWHHFSIHPLISTSKDRIVQCIIELEECNAYGQFGLMWGFDKSLKRVNRFSIPVNGKGSSIVQFEKNHKNIFYGFYEPYVSIDPNQPILFEISRVDRYYFFRVNKQLVYISHIAHFTDMGRGIGFYLEPGIKICVKKLRISNLTKNTISSSQ